MRLQLRKYFSHHRLLYDYITHIYRRYAYLEVHCRNADLGENKLHDKTN